MSNLEIAPIQPDIEVKIFRGYETAQIDTRVQTDHARGSEGRVVTHRRAIATATASCAATLLAALLVFRARRAREQRALRARTWAEHWWAL